MTTVKRITLVGSCAKKLSTPAPARALYRSALFQKTASWADRQGDDWFVLSAAHGLFSCHQTLDPYDFSMRQMTPAQRREWSLRIAATLRSWASLWGVDRLHITLMAGKEYASWVPFVEDWCEVDMPMAGMQIGQRLQWLTVQLSQGNQHLA